MTNEELLIKLKIIDVPNKPKILKNLACTLLTKKIKCQICKKFFIPTKLSLEYRGHFWHFRTDEKFQYFDMGSYNKNNLIISIAAAGSLKFKNSHYSHFYFKIIEKKDIKNYKKIISKDTK